MEQATKEKLSQFCDVPVSFIFCPSTLYPREIKGYGPYSVQVNPVLSSEILYVHVSFNRVMPILMLLGVLILMFGSRDTQADHILNIHDVSNIWHVPLLLRVSYLFNNWLHI